MSKNKLINIAMAAEKLGFSACHIRRLCVEGRIKAEKIGKCWFFPESAVKNVKRQRRIKRNLNDTRVSE